MVNQKQRDYARKALYRTFSIYNEEDYRDSASLSEKIELELYSRFKPRNKPFDSKGYATKFFELDGNLTRNEELNFRVGSGQIDASVLCDLTAEVITLFDYLILNYVIVLLANADQRSKARKDKN